MVLRTAIFFAILINLQFSSSFEDEFFSEVTQPLSTEDHKVLQECHNEDYRSYLKCLKRHKRHHEIPGSSKSCLENCTATNCTSSKCVQDCYTRCKKKITETYSRVTETEFGCSTGNCDKSSIFPNITTNVNINIGLNTTNCTVKEKPLTDANSTKITIYNMITNDNHGSEGPNSKSNCLCAGCNCFPWPPMPQITIGFGPGPIGVGCCFPQPCSCYQQPQQNIDCSSCGNPFLRYRCDVTCYNLNETNKTTTTSNPNRASSSRIGYP